MPSSLVLLALFGSAQHHFLPGFLSSLLALRMSFVYSCQNHVQLLLPRSPYNRSTAQSPAKNSSLFLTGLCW